MNIESIIVLLLVCATLSAVRGNIKVRPMHGKPVGYPKSGCVYGYRIHDQFQGKIQNTVGVFEDADQSGRCGTYPFRRIQRDVNRNPKGLQIGRYTVYAAVFEGLFALYHTFTPRELRV